MFNSLFKTAFTHPDPFIYAIWFFLLLILIEYIVSVKQQLEYYEKKDTFANLAMALGVSFIGFFGKSLAFLYFSFFYAHKLFTINQNKWWTWLLLIILVDFSYYWYHRLSHEVRFLWASHINHHSSQLFNFSTALRQAWVGASFYYIFWLWLVIIGFTPWSVLFCMSALHIYQFWVHTESIKKLGFLEKIIVTPSFHRVHHGSNPQYIDKNHGGLLVVWDMLLGTYEEENEKVIYGLTTNIHSFNPLTIAFHEYKAIWRDIKNTGSFKNKLGYVFGTPSWKPKAEKNTSNNYKAFNSKS